MWGAELKMSGVQSLKKIVEGPFESFENHESNDDHCCKEHKKEREGVHKNYNIIMMSVYAAFAPFNI